MKAIEIVANEGYASLSMRALARAGDMKLGALQYHFPTWRDLVEDLAELIRTAYADSVTDLTEQGETLEIAALVGILIDDKPGKSLLSERLLPQLWAMGRVEPIMGELLHDIYQEYLTTLEDSLRQAGNDNPRAEALSLMSLIEGTTLFMHEDSPWAKETPAVKALLLASIKEKYGA